MENFITLTVNIGIILFLLALGFFVGHYRETSHIRNLDQREQQMSDMLVSQLKSFPASGPGAAPPQMFFGETVIATDYFKSFLAKFRNIFGGEVKSYQSLLIRARRESLMRVLEQARNQGYNAVCNVRYESADIGGNSTARQVAMVCIIATATAYHARPGT